MAKIIVPFHRGQKVWIKNLPDVESILKTNCLAIVEECDNDLYNPRYSLLCIGKNNKSIGGGAWYSHNILTLVEEVTEENLKILEDNLYDD